MGTIGNLFGSSSGMGWTASGTPIAQPTTSAQATQQYGQAQNALQQQQSFLNALQGQNGIGNQQQVYNQLQGVANGTGPNPAQAQLAQATGANTANQAALMAGQRGAGANVGLIARQAAQQGAANQQNAAGQAATLQANQSLGALSQLGGIAGQQVGQQSTALQNLNNGQQNEQAQLLGGINSQNQANVAMQSNLNNANAGINTATANGQQGIIGGVLGGAGSALGLAGGGMVGCYDSGGQVLDQSGGPSSFVGKFLSGYGDSSQPAGNKSGGQAIQNGLTSLGGGLGSLLKSSPSAGNMSGLAGDASTLAPAAMFAADGGQIPFSPSQQSFMGQVNKQFGGAQPSPTPTPSPAPTSQAHGGKVPAKVSPGEKYLKPQAVSLVAEGKANPMQVGETIPGKAKVKGDNLKNDNVSKDLDEGGIVIPRSVTMADDAPARAAAFVKAIIAKQGLRRK